MSPIKRGSTDVSFRVGSTAVSKIQRGASEMWGNYLLDQYGAAAAAYSLRRLRLGHTGPVVQVRRSSDNAEANFTASEVSDGTLAAWVGAGTNGFVKTWYDQSGNSRDITQATAANQPTLVSSGAVVSAGGKPCIDFDGTNDRLVFTGASIASVSALSQFNVAQARDTAGNKNLAAAGAGSAAAGAGVSFSGTEAPTLYVYGVSPEPSSSATTSRVLLSSVINGTALSLYANAGAANSATTATPLAIANSGIILGNIVGQAFSFFFSGTVQESIFYYSDQSSNRAAIRDSINLFYSIY